MSHATRPQPGADYLSARVAAAALIAALAPLALLIGNRDWFFTPEGFLDPWQYVGYFRQYEDLDYYPGDYKLARLPWILAGYFLTRPLPALPAAYLLHGLFLSATTLALFAGMHALFRRPALSAVVAMWFGFYTHAHGSGGWDYHNTGAGAFYLATFMLLSLPATLAGNRLLLMLTGVMAALAIHTNITLVNFLPALALVHGASLYLRPEGLPTVRTLLVRTTWVVLGAVLATALLGLVNWIVGRDFLFFWPLVRIVLRYVGNPETQAQFHQPWGAGWVQTARHLALPAAIFVVGAVTVVAGALRRTAESRFDVLGAVLVVQFLAMALLWVAWQTAGQTALDWVYFAYPLIPSAFVALGGLLSRGWPEALERHWLATIVGSGTALTLCLSGGGIRSLQSVDALLAPSIFISGTAFFFLLFFAYLWRPSAAAAIVLLVMFAVGNRLVATAPDLYAASDRCKLQPEIYRGIVDGASWMMSIDPVYTRVRTWFDENEMFRPLERCTVGVAYMSYSMTAMSSMEYVTPPHPMPAVERIPDESVRALTRNSAILVIAAASEATLQAWRTRLETLGLDYQETAKHRVAVLDAAITLHAWTVSPHTQ